MAYKTRLKVRKKELEHGVRVLYLNDIVTLKQRSALLKKVRKKK